MSKEPNKRARLRVETRRVSPTEEQHFPHADATLADFSEAEWGNILNDLHIEPDMHAD